MSLIESRPRISSSTAGVVESNTDPSSEASKEVGLLDVDFFSASARLKAICSLMVKFRDGDAGDGGCALVGETGVFGRAPAGGFNFVAEVFVLSVGVEGAASPRVERGVEGVADWDVVGLREGVAEVVLDLGGTRELDMARKLHGKADCKVTE